MDPNFAGKPPMAVDLGQMRDTPNRRSHHRRAHSDISYRFDDLLLFDPSDLDLSSIDLTNAAFSPSTTPTPGAPMASAAAFDSSDDSSSGALNPPKTRPRTSGPMGHFRSLSVDSDFFDGLGLTAAGDGGADEKLGGTEVPPAGTAEKGVYRHRHSNSMDGSATTLFEGDSLMAIDGVKKAMAPDRLAELSLIDPKRAKRILANRQSAARSKERKVRYTSELERKVQTLQTEATTLSAQVTMLQRDTTGMTSENKELKMRLQAMEQQAQLRDALNDTLKEEVQRLKIATGQIPPVNGNPFNRGIPPQFSSHQPALHHHFGGHQTQQYQQQQQQQQLQMPQSSANNQTFKGQPHPSFLDFNQRV